MSKLKRAARFVLPAVLVAAATFFAVRIYDIRQMSPLELWHTHVPAELDVEAMDAGDWAAYLAAEDEIFRTVRAEVTAKLPPEARTSFNRYYEGSVVYPAHYAQDWNRSYVLEPAGPAVGAVVLLHGLTDSPYSLRHIARSYAAAGFVAVAIRLPGHGTVPAGLSKGGWEDWMAATRLAVREARRRTGPSAPLHLVGFSNGGALAAKFALDALENPQLARPDRLILVSPMIGITRFARLAGVAGWPAVLPAFARAAWLSIVPEFNPFKYNSFPVNGGRQSYRLTRVLQDQIARMADANTLNGLRADPDVPVGAGFHRQHARDRLVAVCLPAGQRQRTRPVRRESLGQARPTAATLVRQPPWRAPCPTRHRPTGSRSSATTWPTPSCPSSAPSAPARRPSA